VRTVPAAGGPTTIAPRISVIFCYFLSFFAVAPAMAD
jgi:hypothetical protein